ncbi:MAG: hypothetical protein V1774_05770 [Candidatus Eisenbacteria bacterium]
MSGKATGRDASSRPAGSSERPGSPASFNPANPEDCRVLVERSIERWSAGATAAGAPDWARIYVPAQQRGRERTARHLIDTLRRELRRPPSSSSDYRALRRRSEAWSTAWLCEVLGFDEDAVGTLGHAGFWILTRRFARDARRFDPRLSAEDIFQAIRNAWVIGALQAMFDTPVRLSPAVLGYSLLYPYTDNFMDAPGVETRVKEAFSQRLADRLAGGPLAGGLQPGASALEMRVESLLRMIESTFPLQGFPQVRAALLAIHAAQIRSLALQRAQPGAQEVLRISVEKGGASVLADGCLVAGRLTPPRAEACFDYGVFLQFQDDLNDIDSDSAAGIATIFTRAAGEGPLDRTADRLLDFGRAAVARFDDGGALLPAAMKRLMNHSALLLQQQAVALAPERFSPAWVAARERYSPLSFRGRRELFAELNVLGRQAREIWQRQAGAEHLRTCPAR